MGKEPAPTLRVDIAKPQNKRKSKFIKFINLISPFFIDKTWNIEIYQPEIPRIHHLFMTMFRIESSRLQDFFLSEDSQVTCQRGEYTKTCQRQCLSRI